MPSPLPSLLRHGLILGALSGAMEVALRASPRLGLSLIETLTWICIGVIFGFLVSLPAAVVAAVLDRKFDVKWGVGLIASALLALHSALFIRFEWVLNAPIGSVAVWGPLLAAVSLSLVLGRLLDGPLRRSFRLQCFLLVCAVLVSCWRSLPPAGLEQSGQSNVLLVTFDTTRADRLGVYGGDALTPTIDALAADGVLFEEAVAPAPLTEASHLAILTGRSVHRTGIYSNGTVLGHRPELLSHAFQQAGYRTGAVVSGFPLHGKYGWTQGFDFYEDDFGAVPGLHRLSLMKAWDQISLPGNTLRERPGVQTLARAQTFLERHSEGPFFLWVHFFDPHAPYEVSEAELAAAPRDGDPLDLPQYWPPPHRSITSTAWLTEAYEAEIGATDALFGELLDSLEADVRARTIVAFTADHGESLTEHDLLFDHGDFLYDASLLVPLVVAGPGLPAGERVPCQVSGIDLAPTLRALTGLSPLESPEGAGQSLIPLSEECTDRPAHSATVAARHVERPPVDHALRLLLDYGEEEGPRRSKFIQHGKGGEHLFDLVADPEEELNVAEAYPEAAARVRGMLSLMLKGAAELASPETDRATLEALKALGYVQ